MDFSDSHLAALEWSGTYNNVHAGNVVIFRWMETEPMANLSDLSYTCCRFIQDQETLITGGHDKLVSFKSFMILKILTFSKMSDLVLPSGILQTGQLVSFA